MAEPAAVNKPLLPEQLFTKVPSSLPAREQLPACKLEPVCIEEENRKKAPLVCPSTQSKGKESSSSNTIYVSFSAVENIFRGETAGTVALTFLAAVHRVIIVHHSMHSSQEDSLGSNQCFHCLITFPDEKFKERHMKREHPEDFVQANLHDALFICFICSKSFESSRALICHQRGHASVPPPDCPRPTYDCLDCGRRFSQLANYQRHRLGHAAGHSLPHQCSDCSKSFRQLSNLRRHQAFHQQTQELLPSRTYSCMECGENFNQEAGLHEHYIRHARGEL